MRSLWSFLDILSSEVEAFRRSFFMSLLKGDKKLIEKRQFHRIQISSKTILSRSGNTYQGQLENISMTGALIRFEHGTLLPKGSEYELTVIVDGEDAPLQLSAEVVCFTFAMAGIKIVSFKADSGARLAKLIESFSSEPDIEMAEREKVRRLFANYYRDE